MPVCSGTRVSVGGEHLDGLGVHARGVVEEAQIKVAADSGNVLEDLALHGLIGGPGGSGEAP